MQQKLAKRDGGRIDRNRDIEHLWEFYQRYKRRHRVDDMQREEQRLRESGSFSANFGEYGYFLNGFIILIPCLRNQEKLILHVLFFIFAVTIVLGKVFAVACVKD